MIDRNTSHIRIALLALIITGVFILFFQLYVHAVENTYLDALAPYFPLEDIHGSALQRLAFQRDDLLAVYGGSESLSRGRYQSSQYFKEYPTGFETFEVAREGARAIFHAQALTAIGPILKGKKVVISFTPSQFNGILSNPKVYAGSFSRLNAYEAIFSSSISRDIKRQMAGRMVQYPDTLREDPVLHAALQQLIINTPFSQVVYALLFPLGRLEISLLRLQDHYQILTYIWSHPFLETGITKKPIRIAWSEELIKARKEQLPFSNNNPYGFDNTYWNERKNDFRVQPPSGGNKKFIQQMESAGEWADMEVLLQILEHFGAKPLLMGRPLNAKYFYDIGVDRTALQIYYDKLHALAGKYSVPLVDFQDRGDDIYFGVDPAPHCNREGSVYVNQALDAFYHDNTK